MFKIRHLCVLIASLIFFSGCASFKGGKLLEVEALPSLSSEAKQSTVIYEFSSAVNLGTEREHPEGTRQTLEGEFVQVFRDSGYFTAVEKGAKGKDLHVKVRMVNTGSLAGILPAIITGATLYAIPSWATDNFEITANVTTPSGRQEEFQLTDSTTLVQWLPMIIAFPFNNPATAPIKVRKNIYKNLLIQMKNKQLLSKP